MAVLLPAPFGPISAWISPGATVNASSSVATTPPNRFISPEHYSAAVTASHAPAATDHGPTRPTARRAQTG